MARIARGSLPDGAYHVSSRGVDGEPIVRDDFDRLFFARLLRATVSAFNWDCRAWCLLTNHFHLVLEARRADLSAGMKRLNGLYAQRFNGRHRRVGHLFQGRFASWVIDDDDYLEIACESVLANPGRAGLTERVEDWRWAGLGAPSFAVGSRLRRAA